MNSISFPDTNRNSVISQMRGERNQEGGFFEPWSNLDVEVRRCDWWNKLLGNILGKNNVDTSFALILPDEITAGAFYSVSGFVGTEDILNLLCLSGYEVSLGKGVSEVFNPPTVRPYVSAVIPNLGEPGQEKLICWLAKSQNLRITNLAERLAFELFYFLATGSSFDNLGHATICRDELSNRQPLETVVYTERVLVIDDLDNPRSRRYVRRLTVTLADAPLDVPEDQVSDAKVRKDGNAILAECRSFLRTAQIRRLYVQNCPQSGQYQNLD